MGGCSPYARGAYKGFPFDIRYSFLDLSFLQLLEKNYIITQQAPVAQRIER